MCGIIGYKWDGANPTLTKAFVEALLVRSQMRGCHATGIAWAENGKLQSLKRPLQAQAFIYTKQWNDLMVNPPRAAILHTRYSTSGDWQNNSNNQPLIDGDLAIVHNGLVSMATKGEFEQAYHVRCETENDSEIILRKIQIKRLGYDFQDAIADAMDDIDAVAPPIFSVGLLRADGHLLSFNDKVRPLFRFKVPDFGLSGFCSTEDIFQRAMADVGMACGGFVRPTHQLPSPTDLDYRTPENRRAGFIKYYAAMLSTGDIDPAFITMSELFRRYELSIEQRYWVAFIYTIFYHNATTFLFMQEFPELEKVDLPRLDRWLAKHEATLLFQKDRRWNRFKVSAMVKDYIKVLGGKKQHEFFSQFVTPDPAESFRNVWNWMMKEGVYNVGRHSAVAWIETLMRCLNYPVEPDSRVMTAAGSSLEGLALALNVEYEDSKTFQKWLLEQAPDLMRDCGTDDWMYFETVCCAYKGLVKGNRYLGYYLDRMAGEIADGQRLGAEGVNWNTLWEIRREVFPRAFLGELQAEPWKAIRKDRLSEFEDTGAI